MASKGTAMSILEKTAAGRASLHYGWVIVFAGVATVFSSLGLGRFSLGMLLPSMGASLGLSYAQMGVISTGNFIGYMISVVLAGIIARRAGTRATIAAGLILTGGSMALISRAMGYTEVLILYVATGVGSGLANVPAMGLVSHWFLKSTRGRAAGIMLSGNGLAIVFAGIYVPCVNAGLGGQGWRTGWFTMGVISIAIAVLTAILLRNTPAEKGLIPIGRPDASSPGGNIADEAKHPNMLPSLFLVLRCGVFPPSCRPRWETIWGRPRRLNFLGLSPCFSVVVRWSGQRSPVSWRMPRGVSALHFG
jgi:sugar phosphate permease